MYKCHLCESQPGKQTRRKKQEWPRKDNFLAHLSRIHGVNASHADSLEDFIVRNQPQPQPQPGTPPDLRGSNREAAQRNDLEGVGTLPDLNNPETGGIYASHLAHLPGHRANAIIEQRMMKFFENNSGHLGSSNMFESSASTQFISPHMLRHEVNEGRVDPSFDIVQTQPFQFNLANSDNVVQTALQNDHIPDGFRYSGNATDSSGIHETNIENDGTESWISPHPELSDSPDPATSEYLEQRVPSLQSDLGTDKSAIVDILNKKASIALDPSTNFADQVKGMLPKDREALFAVLRAFGANGDEGSIADADTASRGQTACETCGKEFRRPCELTYVLILS